MIHVPIFQLWVTPFARKSDLFKKRKRWLFFYDTFFTLIMADTKKKFQSTRKALHVKNNLRVEIDALKTKVVRFIYIYKITEYILTGVNSVVHIL